MIFIPLWNVPSFILNTLQFAYLLYTQKQTSVVNDLVEVKLIYIIMKMQLVGQPLSWVNKYSCS